MKIDIMNLTDGYYTDVVTRSPVDVLDLLRRCNMWYSKSVHGWLSKTICIFGIITNVINIVVLTRKSMKTAVNSILTPLAFADFMILVSYQPILSFPTDTDFMPYTYPVALFWLILMNAFVAFHAISMWITVVLAVWRVMHVCYPTSTVQCRSFWRARLAIIATYTACVLVCIPHYLKYSLFHLGIHNGIDLYITDLGDRYYEHKELYLNLETWLFNWLLKIVPCFLLIGFTLCLIKALCKAGQTRKNLNMRPEHDRTTNMLIVVLVVFLLANLPQSMAYILYWLDVRHAGQVFHSMRGTLQCILLANSAVNFIVYCTMSSQFRETFMAQLLKPWEWCKSIFEKDNIERNTKITLSVTDK